MTFWTSWNEISLEQLKILNDYDGVVLAVNSQEDAVLVKDSAVIFTNLKILLDVEGEVGELYGITVLPLTVFIDKNGFEVRKTIGLIKL